MEAARETEAFVDRHIGPDAEQRQAMLRSLGLSRMEDLIDRVVPRRIRTSRPLELDPPQTEFAAIEDFRRMISENQVFRSYLGMGYSDCIVPPVIQRNVLEDPGWYTQYTPYQAEIAQGRLEALLNFQTMVMDLTAMEIANASMLDEGTAAAEAMALAYAAKGRDQGRHVFLVSDLCHPQTIEVVRTRAKPVGINVQVGDAARFKIDEGAFGILVQYPATDGSIHDYADLATRAHAAELLVVAATDLLALTILNPPGEWGADIAVGSSQRLGVPLGFGGPHAAFFATRDAYKRQMPGRLVGVSKDADGRNAYRLALQTREQHIRRDKATSNICTAQVLLAIMSSMYAVYHGPKGLRRIAERVSSRANALRQGLQRLGYDTGSAPIFDTVRVSLGTGKRDAAGMLAAAQARKINLRALGPAAIGISVDETTSESDVAELVALFAEAAGKNPSGGGAKAASLEPFRRTSPYLSHAVFNTHHSETEMLRYITRLRNRDLSLAQSMIPLGSCTMKLNATTEMLPVTWPEISRIHPFAPEAQTRGYRKMISLLEKELAEITGFAAISLQPNAGSQGEYAGLLVIRQYHESRGDRGRDVCLIPRSAHGTNPASAAMAGLHVVVVECDRDGNIDVTDLKAKATEHATKLAALMVTYPSTHGVFEEAIQEICEIVHRAGGQVYMDGANMNAQIGLCRPAELGADVCHLNLHKTFCIPHGGGGPGMGPIGVRAHLAKLLPSHPIVSLSASPQGDAVGPVSAAPWGSASILPISYLYIRMMGASGLRQATEVAILNANYIAKRLSSHYPVLYRGREGMVAHECIFDLRPLKEATGVDVEDVAKRLMDYGFHAPTVSFPVAGTLMVEPTESESQAELDRFCDAMIAIRAEIAEIESGKLDRLDNPLKNAPHTAEQIARDDWRRPYSRERAVFPAPWVRQGKFWPACARINNVLGDRQLICGCPPIEAYERNPAV